MGRRSAHEVMEVSDDRLQGFVSLNILNEILDSLCFEHAAYYIHSYTIFIAEQYYSITIYNIHLGNWHFPHIHTKPTKCTSEAVLSAMWCRRIHPFHDHRVLWPHHFPDSLCIRLLPDPHQAQDHLSKRGSKDWLRAFGHRSWCANILRHFFPAAIWPTSSPDESAAKMTAADVRAVPFILSGLFFSGKFEKHSTRYWPSIDMLLNI